MTHASRELSTESGQPVELYTFTIGATVLRYTNAEDTVVFNSNSYFSRQIKRTSAELNSNEGTRDLTLTLPTSDAVSQNWIGIPPGRTMSVEIVRYHRGESSTEFVLVWKGRIAGGRYIQSGTVCEMRGITEESAFSRPIPRFKYQGLCNHTLYDANCTVDRELVANKFTGNVASVVGNVIRVNGVSAKGSDWAVGGFINFSGNDQRMVLVQNGDELTVLLPFASDVLGQSVDVHAGCLHDTGTCDTKFTNILFYGGFPHVPTLNPFQRGLF